MSRREANEKVEAERKRLREFGLHQYEHCLRRDEDKNEAIIDAIATMLAAAMTPEARD